MRMPGYNTVARTWPNDYNFMKHPQILHEKSDHFQIETITPNMSQHVAAGWPNARNMLGPTIIRHPRCRNTSQHFATGWSNACNMLRPRMLRYIALKCCDRLAGTTKIELLLGPACCARLATLLRHAVTCWVLLAQI